MATLRLSKPGATILLDNGPEPVELASLTLANASGSATPAATYYPFGHPFREGDVTPDLRLAATWDGSPVPVQVSGRSSWPDGSLRFARVFVKVPAVAGSGSGTLALISEAGAQPATLPGGATVASVLADLRANHVFTVHAADLRKGRETISIGAGGTGYTTSSKVTFTGGVPDYSPTSSESSILVSGGAITFAGFAAPPLRFTTLPTVTASIGTGATLTYVNPPLDGSGAWTWSADTHLALYNTVDSRGRVRCEAVESGPLCVTFACWGPFADDTGGALHPHLVVRAFYRCWLDGTTGAIDRVEHMHALEQGWMGDLAGGSVQADLEVGDFEVRLGGVAISGRSYRCRVPMHSSHALTTVDGTDPAEFTGGSTWTSGHPTLLASYDLDYWGASYVTPPYHDPAYDVANPISPTTDGTPSSYLPGARDAGDIEMGTGTTGEREDIAIMPGWSVRAHLTQERSYLRTDLAHSLFGGHLPCQVRNPATGRVPLLLTSAAFPNQTAAGLGSNFPTTTFYLGDQAQFSAADFKQVSSAAFRGGWDNRDTTNTIGGWPGPYDSSHMPSLAYHQYCRTGAPWLLETVHQQASQALLQYSTRGVVLPDGQACPGRIVWQNYPRQEAWGWKLVAQACVVTPDDRPEAAYFAEVYARNDAATARLLATGECSAGLGVWSPPVTVGSIDTYLHAPWQGRYLFTTRAWGYLALGRPADTLGFLEYNLQALKGWAGALPGQDCSWMVATYYHYVGTTATRLFDDWADCTQWWNQTAIAADAATGWLSSPAYTGGGSVATTDGANALAVGDRIKFFDHLSNGVTSNGPPATGTTAGAVVVPLALDTWYYIAEVDKPNRQVRISTHADGSDKITSFSASASNMAAGMRKATCPTASSTAGTIISRTSAESSAAGDLALAAMAARLAVHAGVAAPTDTWVVNTESRLESARAIKNWSLGTDWRHFPKWKIRPAPAPAPTP